jgi:SAM-dependent methyltransferase
MNNLEHQIQVNEILQYIGLDDEKGRETQEIQINHRLKLVEKWGIKTGQRILEIGSGQGDMTAALAYTVGGGGKIITVDIAPRDYGAPLTIGESMDRLKRTALGKGIESYFSLNLLDNASVFENEIFDGVVFAHCSWYFNSIAEFSKLVELAKRHTREIYFAEWDLCIRLSEQIGHFIAVMVQGEFNAFQKEEKSNIKTLISKNDISEIINSLKLKIKDEGSFDSEKMQDGEWEIRSAKRIITKEKLEKAGINRKIKETLLTQVNLIGENTKPLDTYWCTII